jgi:hypothetical protein
MALAVVNLVQVSAGAALKSERELVKLISIHCKEFEIEKIPGIKTP